MVFSSPRFLLFLAALLALLALRFDNARKKWLLAAASCFFYAAWDYRYLVLLLTIGVVSYFCGARMSASTSATARRCWLSISTVIHLGLLGYFKYCNFFIDNWNAVARGFGLALPALNVLLPAGISFYTFKTLSYTIDVYRGELAPARSRLGYFTFVTFFPELIAGPIVRASIFLPQLDRPIGPTAERLRIGASMFLLGLTKKLFVADRVAPVADAVFASPETYGTASVWLGLVAYSIQIYCDFSGYSDMAIGTAKMIGYDLPENFNMPYVSRSIAEFWRRWHITLSFWLRDYLYIPLGGSRRGAFRTYVNLLATMALGGLWHGASWNFVLWGTLHGAALAVHRAYQRRWGDRFSVPAWLAMPATLLFAVVCWVPFRARDLPTTLAVLRKLFGLGGPGTLWVSTPVIGLALLVVLGHLAGLRLAREVGASAPSRAFSELLHGLAGTGYTSPISGVYLVLGVERLAGAILVAAWVLTIFYFSPATTSAFIYFRF